jgi:hypothetical protein
VAQYGTLIGVGLVAVAVAVAFALGAKAARSVERFRSEDHETFQRKEQP